MGRSKAGFCHDGRVEQGKVGTLRTARSGTMPCLETQHREPFPWQYPRLPAPSSIDLSGLPPRVVEAAARVLALCREELRSEPRPEAPEEVESRVREATNEFARDVMGAVIENRDDGASRIERDGQSWFRVAVTPKTIMTSLGPVTYRRARYRSGASGASPVPVDESLGLVDDYLTRPAAELGLLMMGHCTARGSGGVLCEDRRHDAVGEHPAAPDPEHARMLGELRPGDAGQHP